jgi:DNA processing protein
MFTQGTLCVMSDGDPRLLEAQLRLAMVPGLGPVLTRRLEETFGDAVAVCAATASELAQIKGIGRSKAMLLRRAMDEVDTEAEQRRMADAGVTVVALSDAGYPLPLRHIGDPPPLLFVRGELRREDCLGLAVVGSRKCTHYGHEQADRLSALCASAGLTIISGGARGIDGAAHEAALRVGGRTIAVLGSGLARPYPPEHAGLFDRIAAGGGAVVTEVPMNTPPVAENFPRRNRIISGMSLGVLVVEAAVRSGALITARLAAEEHHREVMALPGRVDSAASAGCHKIIREGWATLVTGPGEILDTLGEAGRSLKASLGIAAELAGGEERDGAGGSGGQQMLLPDGEAGRLLAVMTKDAVGVDELCEAAQMTIATVQAHLMQLQLSGLVERLPGNRVRRR